ncbi:tRNA-modifying protein YgfZ [Prochlorococcus sp. MIT 1300]|uniref:CAF17-like 4Fe-4S cluster assembly/insertion protein YgfZ n=1 Tax=Prochlorococcus sp. MIT 1300 TaxID=3096218 RepID=UPI002A75CDB9|nr:tRNA-modifying protein YgfZ [Prochlorococcus sp. MIT 1300]
MNHSENSLIWDISRPLLRLEGAGIRQFLHGQTTANFFLDRDKTFYRSCWLTPTGFVRALLEIRLTEKAADILILEGDIDELKKYFEEIIFPADQVSIESVVTIRRLQVMRTLWVDSSSDLIWLYPEDDLPDDLSKFQFASPYQFELWRLKAGFPSCLGEINGKTNPFELGLTDWVSLDKGCYLGQETLAKLTVNNGVKQQLRFWRSSKQIEIGDYFLAADSSMKKPERIGLVTSKMKELNSEYSVGLALIRRKWFDANSFPSNQPSEIVNLSIPLCSIFLDYHI